ncbi:MAG: hypothetical protein AB8F65_01060 [Woeseiaceae bacterium]
MIRKFAFALLGLVSLVISLFFLMIIAYLVSSEIMPALAEGSLNVTSSTMILNRVWQGNEIYVLLLAYLLLAFGFAIGAYRALRKVVNR